MEYILIIGAAFAIAGQFSLNKFYEKRIVRNFGHLLAFPVAVSAVSLILFLFLNLFSLRVTPFGVGMAACNALISALSAILGVWIVRLGRVSVYTMFMMLGGMLLPYLYGLIFLQEAFSLFRMIGLAVLIFVLVLSVWSKPAQEKKGTAALFYLLCVLVFFLNGGIGIVSKTHQISSSALPTYDFLIWNYLFQFVLALLFYGTYRLVCAIRGREDARALGAETKEPGKEPGEKRSRLVAAFMIAALYALFSSGGFFLQLLAAIRLPASMQYPFVTGGSVILTTLAAALFFQEKITAKGWVSLLFLLAGTVLFVF